MQQFQAALGESYRIDRELGRGGMATVFLAHDLKHDRLVALKVLHTGLSASLGPDRFRREIKLAAQLSHPHILSVHDSGETKDGHLWFTMPYVEGESLRDRLRRQRQLPLDEALRIAREVALALDYAHRHGVVHRDIKPENILLVDGQAMVADFGVARALADPRPGETLTQTGMAIGTPAYMSPEQAAGEHAVESASDVYSLGVVLYEMLAGEPPYTGPTVQAIAAKMMAGDPPSIRRTRSSVPPTVDQAIRKALSPVPADRYATAADFARALETGQTAAIVAAQSEQAGRRTLIAPVLAAAGILALLAAGAYVRHSRGPAEGGASNTSGPIRLAVLPFDNLGDSADAYFADGLTDAVRTKLTALPAVEVIASNSSAQYRHSSKSPREIGRELGVRYLLVGKVRWAKAPGTPGRVQITPELIEAESAADKWSAPYDTTLTDVFRVQGAIASHVADALGVALNSETRAKLDAQPTQNLAAYDAYLRGAAIANRGLPDPLTAHRAATAFAQAVALDSEFALAWAHLAAARAIGYEVKGEGDSAQIADVEKFSARALRLAPDLAEARFARALYDFIGLADRQRGLRELNAGLSVHPTNTDLLVTIGAEEMSDRQFAAAEQHMQQAKRVDPRSSEVADELASMYLAIRRFPEAQVEVDRALALEPAKLTAIGNGVDILLAQGDTAGARRFIRSNELQVDRATLVSYVANTNDDWWALDSAQRELLLTLEPSALDGDTASVAILKAEIYWLRGDSSRARLYADSCRRLLAPTITSRRPQPIGHAVYGIALAFVGRRAEAIAEGERGFREDPRMGSYPVEALEHTYVLTGELDKELRLIERMLKEPSGRMAAWYRVNPTFKAFRGNPRFEQLLAHPPTPDPTS